VDILEMEIAAGGKDEELLAVSEALDKFELVDKQKAALVKLRYFAGLTIEEAAKVVGISPATAKRYWTYSRAWLYQEISGT
jgi:RNA polymerase sigma factor (sigma-70 family)